MGRENQDWLKVSLSAGIGAWWGGASDEEAGLEDSQEAEVGAEWGLVRGWWGPEANEEGSVVNWAAG